MSGVVGKAGRPTELTEELFKKIKQSILNGNDLRETAKVCEINEGTFYVWHSDNYLKLADKIEGWKRDRKLMLADKNIDSILELGISDKQVLKVVADMSKFVKETLDKKNYSKQLNTDITSEGKELKGITEINYIVPNGNNIEANTETTPGISGS